MKRGVRRGAEDGRILDYEWEEILTTEITEIAKEDERKMRGRKAEG